jgi:predicted nucleic acid-binding protein
MSAVYVETSALLTWLLGEPRSQAVIATLNRARNVVTSVLSLLEVERALNRAENYRTLTAGQAQILRGMLARSRARWILMEISEEVRTRAGRPFPVEPVRTLDAIHLASALMFMRISPDLQLLSYDERILKNALPLGIAISQSPNPR